MLSVLDVILLIFEMYVLFSYFELFQKVYNTHKLKEYVYIYRAFLVFITRNHLFGFNIIYYNSLFRDNYLNKAKLAN